MHFDSFWSDFFAALLSGLVLALLFFLFREWWHPLPSITGRWYFETHTTSATHSRFEGMRLKYEAMIWQAGPSVSGSTEKIFEHNSKEAFEYDNTKRTHGKFEGFIDRFYLRKNRVVLHLDEVGRLRLSSCIFELTRKGDELTGTFHSTASDSSGTVIWSKDQHSRSFSEIVRDQRAIPRAGPVDSDPINTGSPKVG